MKRASLLALDGVYSVASLFVEGEWDVGPVITYRNTGHGGALMIIDTLKEKLVYGGVDWCMFVIQLCMYS